jgi:hypothetical protein
VNPELLIDAIVRQTTVLLAQLSTAAGVRTPLSSVADQVFLELARELERQGVSKKVAADMFGLALRSYQTKVQRLRASRSQRDRTLWEGILAQLQEGPFTRDEIMDHFRADDHTNIRAILTDLVRSGLVEKANGMRGPIYQLAAQFSPDEQELSPDALRALVWVAIYRGATDAESIVRGFRLPLKEVEEAISQLTKDGRVKLTEDGHIRATSVDIPVGAEAGWEAAVFDHFQAMASALGQKVSQGTPRSASSDHVGGTTLTFEVDAEHPLRDEALDLLRRFRQETDDLFARVREHNRKAPLDEAKKEYVSFYFGQSVRKAE